MLHYVLLGRALLDALGRGEQCLKPQHMPRLEKAVLRPGVIPGVELRDDGSICVIDSLGLALFLIRSGVSEKEAARALNWKMFEEYAAEALEAAGFTVWRDLRLHGRGGFQVDVLGLDQYGRGVVVECKHWNPRNSSPSRLREAGRRHLERLRRLASAWRRVGLPSGRYRLVPALLVLRETGLPRIVEGIPIVPVSRLKGFLNELDILIEDPRIATVNIKA